MRAYVIGKGPRVKTRLAAAKADVDEFLADPLALFNSMQRCLAALVCAEVDESQQQPLAAAGAFLGHFVHADCHKQLQEG